MMAPGEKKVKRCEYSKKMSWSQINLKILLKSQSYLGTTFKDWSMPFLESSCNSEPNANAYTGYIPYKLD